MTSHLSSRRFQRLLGVRSDLWTCLSRNKYMKRKFSRRRKGKRARRMYRNFIQMTLWSFAPRADRLAFFLYLPHSFDIVRMYRLGKKKEEGEEKRETKREEMKRIICLKYVKHSGIFFFFFQKVNIDWKRARVEKNVPGTEGSIAFLYTYLSKGY